MNQFKLFAVTSALTIALSSHAQLNGDGYYRVQNVGTGRYISVCDNKAEVNAMATDVELGALKTYKSLDRVLSDAGTIIYIRKASTGSYHYDFCCQGVDTYNLTNGGRISLLPAGGSMYSCSGTYKGASQTLYDYWRSGDEGYVTTDKTTANVRWNVYPVSAETDNYFGVKGEVLADDVYYTTLYAAFPFNLSDGMKAFYVAEVDATLGVVIMEELTGTIPASTPVILQCKGQQATDNRLHLLNSSAAAAVSVNKLEGTYFSLNDAANGHVNYVPFTSNMRLLGLTADGSLGFVRKSGVSMVPHNQAYLTVAASAPSQLKLMSREAYEAYKEMLATEAVTITANDQTREYGDENPELTYTTSGATLRGTPELTTSASTTSVSGTYPIVVAQGSVENTMPTYVEGTLTITKAPLTIAAQSYEREAGQPNPAFELTYTGFKNSDGTEKLTAQPVVACEANETSDPGEYPITVSGAASDCYAITYVAGTLTVTVPSGIRDVVSTTAPTNVYTATGLLVRRNATHLKGLPKGLYVVNGRKVIVK